MNDLFTDSFATPNDVVLRDGDIELGNRTPIHSGVLGLEFFYMKVNEIYNQYEKLDSLLRKLQDAHEESKAVTSAASMKSIKQRMETDVDQVRKVVGSIKTKIEALDKENLANRQKPGCEEGSGIDRSRTTVTVALTNQLKHKMSEFQTLRENIHQEYREVVERHVFIVTGTCADENTIDNLIKTGDSEHIFQKAIREQGRALVLNTVAEIQERCDAVRELEKKLHELHQVFQDMALLGTHQGDLLDNIESQVLSTLNHVQSGNTSLHKAKRLQKSSRKWTCIAILIFLIIVAIIVVGVLKPWLSQR